MKKDACKRIIVFTVVVLFLGLATAPSIIAVLPRKDVSTKQNSYSDSSTYELLIITPKKYVVSLQPLVKHKNKVGVTANLVTLNEVYSNQISKQGRDNPEKIKYFIKYAIETWALNMFSWSVILDKCR